MLGLEGRVIYIKRKMKKLSLKSQIVIASVTLCIGLVFGYIQSTYYGYIDENNIIHDSLFLPLSALFVIASIALLILIIIQFSFHRFYIKRKNP